MKQIIGPPQKCYGYEPKKMVFPCWAQVKLNGLRARYVGGHFYSGDKTKDKQWNDPVVNHLIVALRTVSESIKLDGEFYRHGTLLQDINHAIGVARLEPVYPETFRILYYVFDSISSNPFPDRKVIAEQAVQGLSMVRFARTSLIRSLKEADAFYEQAIGDGYEGAVYRLPYVINGHGKRFDDVVYVGDYVPWMMKRKESHDAEYEIIGIEKGAITETGSRNSKRLGALVLKGPNNTEFRCGIGFSDKERDEYFETWPKLKGKFLRVQFREKSALGIPQEPRSLGVRDYEME